MYISGMKMGDIVANYLRENDMYTSENYKKAYEECKSRVHKIKDGEGKATRYRYYDSEIVPVLIDWKKSLPTEN